MKIGQVFYLSAGDGARLATPFQPRLEPGVPLDFKPAGVAAGDGRPFVITDGGKKIYLVALADQPEPHLEVIKEAEVSPRPITSAIVVLGDTALAVAGESRLVRFRLPALEAAGETPLPAPAEWGPYAAGDMALVATVDQKLVAAAPAGELRWQVPLEHGQLAGPPLVLPDSVILAYRKGMVERRASGRWQDTRNAQRRAPAGDRPGRVSAKTCSYRSGRNAARYRSAEVTAPDRY